MLDSGKILHRFFKNARYTDDQWESLNSMFENNESTNLICSTFNIKHSYYKALKKYFNENGSIF